MHALVQPKHREYEIVYLLAPMTTPGAATKVGDTVREVVEGINGKILKVDLWGIRTLAYKIKGNRQGIYYCTRFVSTQGAVDEIERRLKIFDSVLRYLIVKMSPGEVDPAAYTVKPEEAQFKPIDEIHASLQAGEIPAAEPGAAETDRPAAPSPEEETPEVELDGDEDEGD